MVSILVIVFALIFIDGAILWTNGIEYRDPINTFNGKALWLYGAFGLVLCMIHVLIFG